MKQEKRARLQALGSLFLPCYLYPEMSSPEPPLSLTSAPTLPNHETWRHSLETGPFSPCSSAFARESQCYGDGRHGNPEIEKWEARPCIWALEQAHFLLEALGCRGGPWHCQMPVLRFASYGLCMWQDAEVPTQTGLQNKECLIGRGHYKA